MDAVKDCSIWGRDMGVGGRIFIKVESGTGPVHAPCPKRGVAKLSGVNCNRVPYSVYANSLPIFSILCTSLRTSKLHFENRNRKRAVNLSK